MKNRVVSANEGGGTITVTKRRKPVATLGPVSGTKWKSPVGILAGKVRISGDIVSFDSGRLWDAIQGKWEPTR